jgi:hypothetical protein
MIKYFKWLFNFLQHNLHHAVLGMAFSGQEETEDAWQ